jgi:glycosyltransferase involved in cell wall biosynthesis
MHVGLVSYSDIDYGFDLANCLHNEGLCVTLYMSRAHAAAALGCGERPEKEAYELGLLPRDVRLVLVRFPRMRDVRSLGTVRRLAREIVESRTDIAHILMGSGEIWIAALACLLRGKPVVSTMREPVPNIGDYPPAVAVFAANWILAHGSDAIIVNGTGHARIVERQYGRQGGLVEYVPLGPRVTAIRWSGKKIREERGNVLFFGSIQRRKGLEYLVRAQPMLVERFPGARIVVAGRGKQELERCRKMMGDERGFEIIEGFVPNRVVGELFQKASVVVLPYVSASTSGIVMTAQAFCKPVVATRVGSLPDYIEDGNSGFLVPPRNSEELATAIVRLLSDDRLRARMKGNIRRSVRRSQKAIAAATLEVYRRALLLWRDAKD